MNVAPGSALTLAPPSALACPPADVRVTLYPNPFRRDSRRALRVPHGDTLAALVADVLEYRRGVPVRRMTRGWSVRVNGSRVAPALWDRYVPPPGAEVVIRQVPGGIIAAIIGAVAAVTSAIGTAAGFSLFIAGIVSASTALAIASAVTLGLNLLLVAGVGYAAFASYRSLASPQSPGRLGGLAGAGGPGSSSSGGRAKSDSPTISGQGNQVNPWQVFWRIYGKVRVRPGIVGKPYTEIDGGKVYLRMRLCVGYGPLRISEMKLGETPLEEFRGTEVEVHEGWADEPEPTLYPGRAVQESYQIRLHSNQGGSTGNEKVRTTALGTSEVGLEIAFPGGFFLFSDAESGAESLDREMKFKVQYRVAVPEGEPTNPWIEPEAAQSREKFRVQSKDGQAKRTGPGTFSVKSKNQARFYVGVRFYPGRENNVAAPDQYDVRVWVTNDVKKEGGPISAEVYWQSMRSISAEPSLTIPNMCTIDLRIRASDQLSGAIETFNCVAEAYARRYLPGSGWEGPAIPKKVDNADFMAGGKWSRLHGGNPAWAYLDGLQGSAQREKIPDDGIDFARIYEWAQQCELLGMRINACVDFGATSYQTLRDICAAGWATPYMRDVKASVVYERNTVGAAPVALLTPRNIMEGSFKGLKSFEPIPHCFRVRFMDEARGYEFGERLVFNDGFDESNADDYAEMECWGITDADWAWKFGRRRLAEMILRPEFFVVEQDIENFGIERGDVVGLSHDVPLLGLAWAAVTGTESVDGDVVAVEIDTEVKFEPGKDYGASIRIVSESMVVYTVALKNPATTVSVTTKRLELEEPLGFPVPAGAICAFGERGLEHRRCIVKEIERLDDLRARLLLVDEAPGIWDAIGGTIPPYDPGIVLPAESAPATPDVVDVKNGQGVITLTVEPASGGGTPPRYFEVHFRESDTDGEGGEAEAEWTRLQLVEVDGVELIDVGPVTDGHYYDLRVRALGGPVNAPSPWIQILSHLYSGPLVQAAAFKVTGLELRGQGSDRIFEGRVAEFVWRLSSPVYTPDPILSPSSLPPGQDDEDSRNPYFLDYEVRVVDPTDPTSTPDNPVRVDHVFARSWEYTLEKQLADLRRRPGLSPMRRLRVGVAFRDRRHSVGQFAWIEVSNPPAVVDRLTLGTSAATIWAEVIDFRDNDIASFRMHAVRADDFPDPNTVTLSAANLVAESTDRQCIWNGATRGGWWVWVVPIDAFGPDGAVANGPHKVEVAGTGVHLDILIGETAITAATSNTVTLAGAPFALTEEQIVGRDAKVRIVIAEAALPTNATGQTREVQAWNATTGVLTIDGTWDVVPTPGTDLAEVVAADIGDGVVDQLNIGTAVIDRLVLRKGAVSAASYAERRGFSEKPRRNRYRSLAATSVNLHGDERVILDAQIKVADTTEAGALNQIIFLREVARGLVASDFETIHACEVATGWSAPDTAGVSTDRKQGAGSMFFAIASGTQFSATLDVSALYESPVHMASRTLRFWVKPFCGAGSLTSFWVYILNGTGFSSKEWEVTAQVTDEEWTEVTLDLSSEPDVDSGPGWDGSDIGFIVFTLKGPSGPMSFNIDDVRIRRDASATTLPTDVELPPDAFESDAEKTYAVALRPIKQVDPDTWAGGTVELSSVTTDQELIRYVIGNDARAIEVGNPPDNSVFPNQDFTDGEPQIGDEWILFELIAELSRTTFEVDTIQLRESDLAPTGSGNAIETKAVEYRVCARRKKDTHTVDQPYVFGSLEATTMSR